MIRWQHRKNKFSVGSRASLEQPYPAIHAHAADALVFHSLAKAPRLFGDVSLDLVFAEEALERGTRIVICERTQLIEDVVSWVVPIHLHPRYWPGLSFFSIDNTIHHDPTVVAVIGCGFRKF